ncbi:MAG: helix-turn-helix domain-containing protein [Thermoanaerobaculia bacterium]
MRPSPGVEQSVERLRRALQRRIRDEGNSFREVEDRLGVGRDYVSQLLRGSMDLKVKHLFALFEVLEMEPGEFFRALYPAARPRKRLDDEFIAVRQEVSIAVIHQLIWTLQERGLISSEEGERLLAPFAAQEHTR